MPSPQASVKLSRSTVVAAAEGSTLAALPGAGPGSGSGSGVAGGRAAGVDSSSDDAAAAFWLRRTAPMEGRRLTSPAGRAAGASDVGEGAAAPVEGSEPPAVGGAPRVGGASG